MKQIVVTGAGRIGATIAEMLAASGDYAVTVADRSAKQLAALPSHPRIAGVEVDLADTHALTAVLSGRFAVLNAAPYHLTVPIAEAAAAGGVHYLDLTEDVRSTRRVKEIAAAATTAFIPQCGLAPGFITIAANSLAKRFDVLHDVKMRVGALPQFPANALNYNLTWSPEGVINEYCEPCEAIVDGELKEVAPLEGLEEFSLDGVRYEAFNTSGGLGSICQALEGRVRNLNYRTVRYPGHAAIMKILLNDLRLAERRDLLKDVFEHALPATMQDVVVIFVTITGLRNGRLLQESYANTVHADPAGLEARSAIQKTTAAGICTVLDLLATGRLPARGLVQQEDIALEDFLANRFGRTYAPVEAAARAA
ncbi:saccharopine dehydrogenase family protein [Nitratireductor sp. ZSWI3]|uniref:saccharopine dehydrogenase family protein n=1 Tax=Nitratireductor sp. ZSWI3 TaxID=2966359 RepID=UPI002150468B|nr:saccharopine dehydrogenase family protein [Nitratireductor sp. ZSWI3]MCR4268531.1 saccharopine dehydrogenase family protein [Nitratireductor sp. ZSWI3]